MSHLDDEKIALIAMGEPVGSDADMQHLVECESCAAEVAEMSRVALVARSSVVEGDLEAPPADVWSRIHGELGLTEAVAADPASIAGELEPRRGPSTSRGPSSSRIRSRLLRMPGIRVSVLACARVVAPRHPSGSSPRRWRSSSRSAPVSGSPVR